MEAIRATCRGIDLANALADRAVEPELLEVLSDMWHDPGRYLAIFREGRVPTLDDARLDEQELASRLQDPELADAVAPLSADQFEAVLQGSIEEWMFYLHPAQSRIETHPATGPSRVRGRPGHGENGVGPAPRLPPHP